MKEREERNKRKEVKERTERMDARKEARKGINLISAPSNLHSPVEYEEEGIKRIPWEKNSGRNGHERKARKAKQRKEWSE